AKRRKTTAGCKRQRAARVDWHKLFRPLHEDVGTDAQRVITARVRHRILDLPVVEDAALRETLRQSDCRDRRARKGELRSTRRQGGVAWSKEQIEPPVTETRFVYSARRENVRVADVHVLRQRGHVDFETGKLAAGHACRRIRKLVGEQLLVREISERDAVLVRRRPIDTREVVVRVYRLRAETR